MIKIENVSHFYGDGRFQALCDINVEIEQGKFVLILGQSGSGKTTLLNIIAGLLKPTSGRVIYEDIEITGQSRERLALFRSENIGFVFQNYFLEKCYTALENVMVPLFLNKRMNNEGRKQKAEELLKCVGLDNKMNNKPKEMSGGECQRVSIARALANDPKYIIADEPTGNLDTVNGENIISILKQQVSLGKTVIMVTHNEVYSKYADQIIRISDGKLI